MVGEEILEIDHRRIPSREILERSFVAVPLAEVAPDLVHPEEGVRISEIAARFTDDLRIADLKLSVDPTGLSE
jgi:2-amino-4-hydroxy-6-hydroxymethyldihydropteridine diphosphokinase